MKAFILVSSLLVVIGWNVLTVRAADDAKKPTDEEITKLLPGKWLISEEIAMGVKIKGSTTYDKDGSFVAEGEITANGNTMKINVSGTWKVKDGYVIETAAKSDIPNVKAGDVTKDQVLQIDEKTMKIKDEMGRAHVATRDKK